MVLTAHFESADTTASRPRPHRRRLELEVAGSLASGDAAAVLIHNVSASGLLLETGVELTSGERIDIDLPDLGPTPATIVWTSDRFYGGKFDAPLSLAVLSALELRGAAMAPSPKPSEESLAARLRDLRRAKGMSLDAVAQHLGVSKPTVWAWENGRARPSAERFAAIAELFALDQASLTTGRDTSALDSSMAQARQQVASAYGVDPARVRILIEL